MACGDIDNDGDVDFAVQNLDNSLRVYRNDAPAPGSHWLLIRAMTGPRDAYGAQITVDAAGKRLVRLAHPAYSYLASNDPRVHIGLGPATKVTSIIVRWPNGASETFGDLDADRVVTLQRGKGTRQ
jgi:hypothetical protein